ncbi:predicted protein [Histoplasma capsulatum G186AR]|uniref:Uncharacterized protein n=1 Tax=Ajellomyces capsulatus (strain G186AR / H82 / ATCC MYA-2454 / RMSCC 2432) TaxID=447093 RepID=C0NMC2_AJECG|nr:uncharacterized protein HCBG_04652 [Histoplasma capsulatum G186AR]EEH07773.1 predicted protein [Histoplasma capsulatum G186AR]
MWYCVFSPSGSESCSHAAKNSATDGDGDMPCHGCRERVTAAAASPDLYIGWICLWSTLVPKPTNLSSFNQTREAYQGTLPGPKNKAKTLRESKKGARLLQAKNLFLVPFILEASANAFQRLGGAIPNGTSVLPAFPSGPGGWLV